jgi:hypothetical protein
LGVFEGRIEFFARRDSVFSKAGIAKGGNVRRQNFRCFLELRKIWRAIGCFCDQSNQVVGLGRRDTAPSQPSFDRFLGRLLTVVNSGVQRAVGCRADDPRRLKGRVRLW